MDEAVILYKVDAENQWVNYWSLIPVNGLLYKVEFGYKLDVPHNPWEALAWIYDEDSEDIESGKIESKTPADQIGVRIAEYVAEGYKIFND